MNEGLSQAISTYFASEEAAGLLLVGLGGLAVGSAAALWKKDHPFKWAAPTLLLFALAEIVVGAVLVVKSSGQAATLLEAIPADQASSLANELDRMTGVFRQFKWLKKAELVFMAGPGVLLLIPALRRRKRWAGLATGLFIQAAVLFVFDVMAEKRAQTYADTLRTEAAAAFNALDEKADDDAQAKEE